MIVRRALGIPDLIGESAAMEIVADRVYDAIGMPRGTDAVFEERIGAAVFDVTVKAGVSGELDRFIMGRPDHPARGSTTVIDADYTIVTRGRATDGAKGLARGAAAPILNKVREYVLAHHFECEEHCMAGVGTS